MADIWLGLAFVTVAFLLIAVLTDRYAKGASTQTRTLVALTSVLVGCSYILFAQNDVRIAEMLPFSNLIVVGNGCAYLAAILIGLVASDGRLSTVRRLFAEVTLTTGAAIATVHPVVGAIPDCSDLRVDGICAQSTDHTCAAACAVTLLESVGINTTEQEMAIHCFSDQGTTWSGLYRGLALKVRDSDYRVKTFVADLDGLRELDCRTRPIILTVGLTREQVENYPEFAKRNGWVTVKSHTVLLYGFVKDDLVLIGDPSVGRELWTVQQLRFLWQGSGQMLVRR
jgi:predicted double-glycine peptidase